MGRTCGGFGIYEGNLRGGLPHGFGRQIWRNGNWYLGYFANGAMSGDGEYHKMSIQRTFKGLWSKSVLVNSFYPDEMKGLKIDEPVPQTVKIPEEHKTIQMNDVLIGPPDISGLKITT